MRACSAAALFAAGLAAAQSTTYTTLYSTVFDCPASVTNCPARTMSQVLPLVTQTVYTTRESTIYQCPASVTDCPAESAVAITTTVVEADYTTVCPVEQAQATAATSAPWFYPNSTILAGPTGTGGPTWTPIATTWTALESETAPVAQSTWTTLVSGTIVTETAAAVVACETWTVNTISTSITTVIPTVIYETVSVPCVTPVTTSWAPYTTVTSSPIQPAAGATLKCSAALAAVAGLIVLALA